MRTVYVCNTCSVAKKIRTELPRFTAFLHALRGHRVLRVSGQLLSALVAHGILGSEQVGP